MKRICLQWKQRRRKCERAKSPKAGRWSFYVDAKKSKANFGLYLFEVTNLQMWQFRKADNFIGRRQRWQIMRAFYWR